MKDYWQRDGNVARLVRWLVLLQKEDVLNPASVEARMERLIEGYAESAKGMEPAFDRDKSASNIWKIMNDKTEIHAPTRR